MTKMDLDSSLDDIIKQKKQKNTNNNKKTIATKSFTTTKKTITKANDKKQNVKSVISRTGNSNIISRLSGGGFSKNNNNNNNNNNNKNLAVQRADPSQIIITKNISSVKPNQQSRTDNITIAGRLSNNNNKNNNNNSSIFNRLSTATTATTATASTSNAGLSSSIMNRLGGGGSGSSNRRQEEEQEAAATTTTSRPGSISIRGQSRAKTNNQGVGGFSIRGESGPSTVLLSNLDPLTSAEDVKTSCSIFGNITRCDVLKDRNGYSYGEAELHFSTKSAALDCIAKLDNEYADGRLIRAVLRDPKPPKTISYASKQIRSTLAHASGKMYSDQINNPRYDVQR